MKIDTQEKIRLATGILGVGMLAGFVFENRDNWFDNYLTLNNQALVYMMPFLINCLTVSKQEVFTDEYKQLKKIYDNVVFNFIKLTDTLGINDSIEIFAFYVYMYRHGYLSHNNQFIYKNDMKDFAKLAGVDVIRGKGVCRSISSMLTDIYTAKGMKATNVSVRANDAISSFEKLCDINKQIDEDTKDYVKTVINLTEKIPLANHLITMVECDGFNFILDPTNDGFLQYGGDSRLLVANNCDSYMTIINSNNIIQRLMSQTKIDSISSLDNQLLLPTIEYDEYKKTYLEVLKFCRSNVYLFKEFYDNNKYLYNEIFNISDNQQNIVKRMFPIHQLKKYK